MMLDNCNPFTNDKKYKKCPETDYCIFFYNLLWDKAITFFEWRGDPLEGPDATMNRDYLEWCLLSQGHAGILRDKKELLRGLRCTRVGLDPYNFPREILCANFVLGELRGEVNKTAVWVRNNKFAVPAISKIVHYAKALARIQLSLDISLQNNRMTKVFAAENDHQAQQIRKLVDNVSAGKDAVIIKSSIMDNILAGDRSSIPVYGTPSEYLADSYIQDMRSVMNDFFVCFGVNASGANVIKKERNLTSEVNSNNQEIIINREFWLSTRREAAELCNDIFGTNLTVDIRKPTTAEIDREQEEVDTDEGV